MLACNQSGSLPKAKNLPDPSVTRWCLRISAVFKVAVARRSGHGACIQLGPRGESYCGGCDAPSRWRALAAGSFVGRRWP